MSRPGGGDDRGSAAVELALVSPVLIALMLLVVLAGRVAEADVAVRRAASEAARAASMRQDAGAAVAAAETTVAANLMSAGMSCTSLEVATDTSALSAGGQVTVTVTCVADMSDVTFLAVPGTRTFSSTAVEVVDTYREIPASSGCLQGPPARTQGWRASDGGVCVLGFGNWLVRLVRAGARWRGCIRSQ